MYIVVRRRQASSGVVRRRQASSGVVRRRQASSGVVRRRQALLFQKRIHRHASDCKDQQVYATNDAVCAVDAMYTLYIPHILHLLYMFCITFSARTVYTMLYILTEHALSG